MKRLRPPKVKPGQLRMYWGREDRWSGADVIIAYGGGGATKQDSALLYHYIGSEKMARDWSREGGPIKFDPSLIKELEARGYDLTTLKFSIERKKDGNTD